MNGSHCPCEGCIYYTAGKTWPNPNAVDDHYCELYGTNRSAFIALKLGEIVAALDMTYNATDNLMNELQKQLSAAISSTAEPPALGNE